MGNYLNGKPFIYVINLEDDGLKVKTTIETEQIESIKNEMLSLKEDVKRIELQTSAKYMTEGSDGGFAQWLKLTTIEACEALLKKIKGVN